MATKLKILRSTTPGLAPTAGQLEQGQLAMNIADGKLFTLNAAGTGVTTLADSAAVTAALAAVRTVNGVSPVAGALTLAPDDIGTNGVAPLDVNGKVPLVNLPDSITGGLVYIGTYDAATNIPALPDPTTNKGNYWVVSVAGTQEGLTLSLGDWVISNGTDYEKLDAQDAVQSVNGQIGIVTLDADDVGAVAVAGGVVAANLEFSGDLDLSGDSTVTGTLQVPDAVLDAEAVNKGQMDAAIAAIPAGGTVESVNGIEPVAGNVTLVATDVQALPALAGVVSVATTFSNPVTVPDAALDAEAVNKGQLDAAIAAIPAGGTVTSVAMTVPAELFEVAGSPITEAGTFAITLVAQEANTVLAGPTDGVDAPPTFRLLEEADLPPVIDEGTF